MTKQIPVEEMDWEVEFDKKWKNVECSAHERTSSASCICDELDDINSDYGYDDIKDFIREAISTAVKEDRERIVEAVANMPSDWESRVSVKDVINIVQQPK